MVTSIPYPFPPIFVVWRMAQISMLFAHLTQARPQPNQLGRS